MVMFSSLSKMKRRKTLAPQDKNNLHYSENGFILVAKSNDKQGTLVIPG